ncbi:MAG: hypothetical protein NZ602_04670 [Thermoguttaceae bacterium]|nr:hypothetical protein [Thermoguttaceae bacterium]
METGVWLVAGAANVGFKRSLSMHMRRLPGCRIYRHRRRPLETMPGDNSRQPTGMNIFK